MMKLWRDVNYFCSYFSGLWRYNSWTWWNNGQIWLSVPHGNICSCLLYKFYQVNKYGLVW